MPDDPLTGGALVSALSNAIVGLHRKYYGKGPTKAKTYLLDEHVLVVMSGGVTTVEETLTARGRAELVQEVRKSFQEAMHDEFTGTVEHLTGRPVRTYFSQFSPEHGITFEFFSLEPDGA